MLPWLAHDSGPVWVASPLPYGSLIRYSMPVLTGAFPDPWLPPWLCDTKTNAFEQLAPKRSPVQGEVTVAEYIQDQNAIYAVIRASSNREHEEWVYSFDRNNWAPLLTTGPKSHFTQPYGQLAYVAKYGVIVAVRGTYVMRPDVGQ